MIRSFIIPAILTFASIVSATPAKDLKPHLCIISLIDDEGPVLIWLATFRTKASCLDYVVSEGPNHPSGFLTCVTPKFCETNECNFPKESK